MTGGDHAEAEMVAVATEETEENAELVLFHVKECYVYLIPPRKSAASYRADEWDISKWVWEGALKVVSKGANCSIRLEDTTTGELYAQAPVKEDQPLPVEAVIDSSRFFVLRIEENSSGKSKHAFIGLGFRERPQAYDFQAALFDHVKYLNKKKEAEEMEQDYHSKPSADYSLKEGETLRLQLNTPNRSSGSVLKAKILEKSLDVSSGRQAMPNPDTPENYPKRLNGFPCLVPPPPPPLLMSAPCPPIRSPSISASKSMDPSFSSIGFIGTVGAVADGAEADNAAEEDFGDFQGA